MDWRSAADTAGKGRDGSLSRVVSGRMAALAFVLASLLVMASELVVPGTYSRIAVVVIGTAALVVGAASWWIPWERLPRTTVLWLVPVGLAAIGVGFVFGDRNSFNFSVTFVLVFVLIGLTQRRWVPLKMTPVLLVAYVVPLVVIGGHLGSAGLESAIYVVPACVALGELIAWGMSRLAEANDEIAEGEASVRQLFDAAPIGICKLGIDGRFIEVNRAYGDILGYDPDQLVGMPMQSFTHPDDRAANQELIGKLLTGELDQFKFEKRYLRADGHQVWVSVNGSVVRGAHGEPLFLIGQIEDITERRQLSDELALHAVTDPLTGLPNRTLFMERLETALHHAETSGRQMALMFLDLDRFKLVNDGIGHDAGDRLLRRVGQRLQGALRSSDVLARFGGDEFTVLCEVAGVEEVDAVVARLRASMATAVAEPDFEQFVSLSIGVALSHPGGMAPSVLLRSADIAMYQAKRLGPGRYVVYEERDEGDAGRKLRMSNELHRAVRENQLVLHYQPYIDMRDMTLVGTEALVRWRHPERGLLPPGEFIELAEECGLMVELGAWVLREACRQGARWMAGRAVAGIEGEPPAMSVNISPQQLSDPGFTDIVASVLVETGFPPERLWLEITEGALMRDPGAAIAILRTLRELGVHLAIDDFGTGYSSLSYLRRLPVEALKIDRSFIEHLDEESDDRAIVEAVVALGDALGLGIIAEGIERPSQAIELASLGSFVAQGYLYARPVDPLLVGDHLPRTISGWEANSRLSMV
jgi:diguanylate cyclase (GGDEF)-like protein/PAS domain S-box-containing protein